MVSPPRKPVTSSRRSSSSGLRSNQASASPMSRPPTQFTASVPSGKPAQRAFSHRLSAPARQRAHGRARRDRQHLRCDGRAAHSCGPALPEAMPQRASAASSLTRASTQREPSGVLSFFQNGAWVLR